MGARIDQMTSFTYTIYIHATPERVWQGLTDPAFTKRYWQHQRAGAKTFRSDWRKGSTYDLAHEEVGLIVSDPEQVVLEDAWRGVVKLTVVHDGFEPCSHVLQAISNGWPAVLASLKTLLETGSALPAT